MPILITHTKVKAEAVPAVEAAGKKLFEAIARARPGNVRCVSSRLADGLTFVTVLDIDDGTENPLPRLPAFRELQEVLGSAVTEPPVAGPASVIGDYRMLASANPPRA